MDGNNMNNQNNYSQADYTYAAEGTYEMVEQKGNALAIVSLVTGILSIVCCCVPIASWITGAAGIVCGALGMKRCEKVGMARVGMILGIVGVVFGTIMFIVNLVLLLTGNADPYYYYY